MLRKCSHCQKTKDLEEFTRNRSSSKGFSYLCKECVRIRSRNAYYKLKETHPERLRARARKQYYENLQDPIKVFKNKARTAAHNAYIQGKIKKRPCFKCEQIIEPMHMHHFDYAKPLEVIWLCQTHHFELHRNMDTYKNHYSEQVIDKCASCGNKKTIYAKEICRTCYNRRYNAKYNSNNPTSDSDLFRCGKCKLMKPKSDFFKHANKVNGINHNCRECFYEYRRAWRAKQRDLKSTLRTKEENG